MLLMRFAEIDVCNRTMKGTKPDFQSREDQSRGKKLTRSQGALKKIGESTESTQVTMRLGVAKPEVLTWNGTTSMWWKKINTSRKRITTPMLVEFGPILPKARVLDEAEETKEGDKMGRKVRVSRKTR